LKIIDIETSHKQIQHLSINKFFYLRTYVPDSMISDAMVLKNRSMRVTMNKL